MLTVLRMGWAAGLQINHGGPFKNSRWALFGITTPAFYRSPEFALMLPEVPKKFQNDAVETWAAAENSKALGML